MERILENRVDAGTFDSIRNPRFAIRSLFPQNEKAESEVDPTKSFFGLKKLMLLR